MSHVVRTFGRLFAVCLILAVPVSVQAASLTIDDFSAPDEVTVPVIILLDPDPTLVETPDPQILGEERDILVDVIGTPSYSSFIGEIGEGSFIFGGSSPGTVATIQYDGDDDDTESVEQLGRLNNAEGLGGLDLTPYGLVFALDFLNADGGQQQSTGIEIEVHSSTNSVTYQGAIDDSGSPFTYSAPFADFRDASDLSDPSVFTDVASIEFRLNHNGADDVDFELDAISVVPEPSTLAMLAAVGLLGLLIFVWQRRRQAA